ncbi:MAG: hypothetical protein F2664_07460 [Actinobacteria bacterium]|uniref:Unannotated protein n=1 Tax=freshwater metagenome TaxID=449393 RepID=A0A6J6Q4P1_9ZZZZ|nr:hypothetical protein [Actinomycetota bacterium]
MSRIRNLFHTLQPAELFSRLVIIGVVLEFGLGQLLSPYGSSGHRLLDFASYTMTVLVTFTLIAAIFFLLRRHLSKSKLCVSLLIALPISSLISGALMGWVRVLSGLDPTPVIALRSISTFGHVTIATLLLWLAASGISQHYQRLDALLAERDRLESLKLYAKQEVESLNPEATEAIRRRILADLEPLKMLNARNMISSLILTIEKTIRPLSRQLESEAPTWTPPEPQNRESERINWRAAAVDGTAVKLLNPFYLLLTLSLIATPMNLLRVGPGFAIKFIVVTFLFALPVLSGIRWIFLRVAGERKGMLRILLFLFLYLMCGLAWGGVTLIITLDTPKPLRFLTLCPAFTLVFGFIWGFTVAAQQRASAMELALKNAAGELRWTIARKRELHRQQRRALAHALHGRIQAALAAGVLELERNLKTGEVSEEVLDATRARILDCVQELNLREVSPLEIEVIWEKVQATWSGAVELLLSVDPSLESALKRDLQALATLNDVLPEVIFNSIKHGKATEIRITLSYADARTFSLVVEDNGSAPSSEMKAGLGSSLLDTCAINWSLVHRNDRTSTALLLPIA